MNNLSKEDIKSFYDKKNFLHDRFANYMLRNDKIKRINGQLHIYDGKVYVGGNRAIESKMVRYIPALRDSQRKEVLKYLEILVPDNVEESGANYIAFNNGIYDLNSDTMYDFSPDLILTNLIPHSYSPQAMDNNVDKVLDKLACNDRSIRALLEEAIGYSFYRRNELSKAFVLVGPKSNGKSTFLSMLEKCLGSSNYTSLDLEELNERFSTVMLAGRLACIGDDIGDGFLQGRAVAMFKKIVSGNTVKAEYKGENAFIFKPYTKLFFSTNTMARMKDNTGAVIRRLVMIPMNAKFTKDSHDYDPYIVYKLTSENAMEYLINLGIAGLKRIIANNGFTECEATREALREYEEENNPVIGFVAEYGVDNIVSASVNDIYNCYSEYCNDYGMKPESRTKFSRTICMTYNLETQPKHIEGKNTRVFKFKNVANDI